MSRKGKGVSIERELIHLFWAKGVSAVRVAGSGSMNYPSPDIIVGNNNKKFAIECKSNKSCYVYLTKKEIEELKIFSELFGAVPLVGVRFNHMSWLFLKLKDLEETNKNFVVSIELAKNKGIGVESLFI